MEDLLDELYLLAQQERVRGLTQKESERYLELYEILVDNKIEIPFGINI